LTSYSTTISNGLNVSGQGPTEKWNDFLWGTDVWLGPQSIYIQFVKGIINSVSLSDALAVELIKGIANTITISDIVKKEVTKQIDNAVASNDAWEKHLSKFIGNNVGLVDTTTRLITKLISNGISVVPDPAVTQQKGIWDIVFPGGTTDATEQSVPVYTEQADPSTTWSSINAGPTTWTEV